MTRIPMDEHAARLTALLAPLRRRGVETVELGAALDRVSAIASTSPIPLPPFRNSQMDGFALRAVDTPGELPIVGEIAAGSPPRRLRPGTTVAIMTGAPMPPGADAVVPVEDAVRAGGRVRVPAVARGAFVRDIGSDLAAGAVIVPAGTRLRSRHLAALAAAGLTSIPVTARPRLAIVSTGSELVAPGEPLAPGRIPDANGVALAAAARETGAVVVHRALVADRPEALAVELDAAVASGAELLVTSGGISMGRHEVVRELLEPIGARVDTVAIQPGGPQAIGSWRSVPVVCLPGNPVSSQLSFELFVAPVLREIGGLPAAVEGRARLSVELGSAPGRRQYLRGRYRAGGGVETVSGPGSHLVAGLAAAELLIVVPEEATVLRAGDEVEVREL